MTRTTCRIPSCNRDAGQAFVCKPCGHRLRDDLVDVEEWLAEDLRLVLTRQVRYGSGGYRARGTETPLPFASHAGDALRRLSIALDAAVDRLLPRPGWIAPPRFNPAHPSASATAVEAAAGWLRVRVNDLRHLDAAVEVEGVLGAVHAAQRAVDRPADRWFAGPCYGELPPLEDGDEPRPCGVDLYARTGAAEVECRRCGSKYDVDARRAYLLKEAESSWVDAATLSRAVSWLSGLELKAERIRKWKQRGRIPHIPERCAECQVRPKVRPCPMDKPLYRVGDAIDLLVAELRKKAELAEQAAENEQTQEAS